MLSNLIFVIQTIGIIMEYVVLTMLGCDEQHKFEHTVNKLNLLNMFYVKTFQAISTNSYILSNEQMSYLSKYTDNAPFNPNEIDPGFEVSIGKTASRLNDNLVIDKENGYLYPYKSGMIALVYTGTLNGKRIIIKVLRKNIRARMEVALERIDFLGKLLGRLPHIKELNLGDLIEENKLIMLSQTSLSTEVENIQTMFKNCLHTDYVIIPRVYPEYTNDDNSLIVMDYIDGRKLDDISHEDKETYCTQLAQFGIKCIMYNRVYHGDLHPGNILFIKDEFGNQRLGIIDFGIMGEITREEQNYYYNLLTTINDSTDYVDVVTLVLSGLVQPQQRIKSLTVETRAELTARLATIFHYACTVKRSIDTSDIYNITKILRAHNLTLAKHFCKIQLCMAVADSVIRELSDTSTYLDNIKKVVTDISIPR